ncbi:4605_t:CDS:2 [Scutellospora calospora]|uniref:4605_t:CDS:1 n=1 Tax=Scutellospora calospora TaxID=85575 RepID=A0ACA9LW32_9GLOM|nr:4605_t:CDS:2 [Scutellospora calospora]
MSDKNSNSSNQFINYYPHDYLPYRTTPNDSLYLPPFNPPLRNNNLEYYIPPMQNSHSFISQNNNTINYQPNSMYVSNEEITKKIVGGSTKETINMLSDDEIVDKAIDEMVDEIDDEIDDEIVDEMIDETVDENELKDSNNSTLWSHSDINKLLDILAINWELYKSNKTKFCATAAIKLGKNKTGIQIKTKLQSLKTKYSNEKKEVTGKATSKWPYLEKMDHLFGSRENINPDYLISSLSLDEKDKLTASNNKDKKKRKISDTDQLFLDELNYLREAKKKSLKMKEEISKQKTSAEFARIDFEREKFNKEFNEKVVERQSRIDLEYEKLRMENERIIKQMEMDHQLQITELEFKYKCKKDSEIEND